MAYYRKRSAAFDRQRDEPKHPEAWGAKCSKCPLRGHKPVWGDGPEAPMMAVVLDAPGHDEEKAGIPAVGKAGQYIEGLLSRLGLSRREVLIDHAVLCMPDGGDMKTFLAVAKKEFKAEQKTGARAKEEAFATPVDCCRPRLMRSLGIPQCGVCLGWDLLPHHPKRCQCPKPRWIHVAGRPPVKAAVAAGNAALEALEGHGGVMAKQAYVFSYKERSRK